MVFIAPERAVICVCLTALNLIRALNVYGRACVCVSAVDQPTETISYLLAKPPQQSESIVLAHFKSVWNQLNRAEKKKNLIITNYFWEQD